jgi:hypothetical protein
MGEGSVPGIAVRRPHSGRKPTPEAVSMVPPTASTSRSRSAADYSGPPTKGARCVRISVYRVCHLRLSNKGVAEHMSRRATTYVGMALGRSDSGEC